MNQEQSSFDDRFRIEQKGMDDTPRSENVRYSKQRTSGISTIKLIALGGGVIILLVMVVIIFNLGTRTPTPISETSSPTAANSAAMISLLEQRLGQLETSLGEISEKISTVQTRSSAPGTDLDVFMGRLDRVENAVSTKFGIITDNMDKLDVQMADVLNRIKNLELNRAGKSSSPQVSQAQPSSVRITKKSAGTATVSPVNFPAKITTAQSSAKKTALKKTVPKVVKKATSSRVYHVIKKGETFYSISKKYGTTVANIHKLNHFSKQPTIYPGDKLIVK